MKSEELGDKYNKIAQWWTDAQMQNSEYCMAYIRKAKEDQYPSGHTFIIYINVSFGWPGSFPRNMAPVSVSTLSEVIRRKRRSKLAPIRIKPIMPNTYAIPI